MAAQILPLCDKRFGRKRVFDFIIYGAINPETLPDEGMKHMSKGNPRFSTFGLLRGAVLTTNEWVIKVPIPSSLCKDLKTLEVTHMVGVLVVLNN